MKDIDSYTEGGDQEKLAQLTPEEVHKMIDNWLSEFDLVQPSSFFAEHPTNDTDLCCNIMSKKDFCLFTMEFFGLPKNYMEGNGHFPNWEEERAAAKAKKGKGKAKVKMNAKMAKRKAELLAKKGIVEVDENARPTHFDIEVFRKCLKRFISCNGEMRSTLRTKLLDDMNKTRKCFMDDHGEPSYKKVVDVYELSELM